MEIWPMLVIPRLVIPGLVAVEFMVLDPRG
jgi:hypothetical protein